MSLAFAETRPDPGRFIPKPDRPMSAAYAKHHAKAVAEFRDAFDAVCDAEAQSTVAQPNYQKK
jgi:hypothetical protein